MFDLSKKWHDLIHQIYEIVFSSDKLSNLISNLNLSAYDVGDYGEIDAFYRFYIEFDVTLYVFFKPSFNDHHSDVLSRKITDVIFTESRYHYNINRLKINELHFDLQEKMYLKFRESLLS